MITSVEAKKIITFLSLEQVSIDQVFYIERILQYTYPERVMPLIKKNFNDLEKVRAMVSCGYLSKKYYKDYNIDNLKEFYTFLTNSFLIEDFPHKDFKAMIDLNKLNFLTIMESISKVKVKNLWYLLKTVKNKIAESNKDKATYHYYLYKPKKRDTFKNKIDVSRLKEYVK